MNIPEGYSIKFVNESIMDNFIDFKEKITHEWVFTSAAYGWDKEKYLSTLKVLNYDEKMHPILQYKDEIVGFAGAWIEDDLPIGNLVKSAFYIPPVVIDLHVEAGNYLHKYMINQLKQNNIKNLSCMCGSATGNSDKYLLQDGYKPAGTIIGDNRIIISSFDKKYLAIDEEIKIADENSINELIDKFNENFKPYAEHIFDKKEKDELICEFIDYTNTSYLLITKNKTDYILDYLISNMEQHDKLTSPLFKKAINECEKWGIKEIKITRIFKPEFEELLKKAGAKFSSDVFYWSISL